MFDPSNLHACIDGALEESAAVGNIFELNSRKDEKPYTPQELFKILTGCNITPESE